MEPSARVERAAPWAAFAALVALGLYRFGAILRGLSTDFADFQALHGNFHFNELPDSRLNSWILGWVDHAVRTSSSIWDANIFHPAPNMLAGSEHLFGVLVQLAPALPFSPNAVALHQLALVVSTAVLSAATFRAIHWGTGSIWAAFLGGAFAVMMPWRISELAHLQLSSAQLLPLIWLGVVRGLLGEARTRDLVLLGALTAIQLLSSFYLAYFLTISSAVLVATVCVMVRPPWQLIARLAAAVAPGFVLFGLSALPYLERQATADLVSNYDPSFSLGLAGALATIQPQWPYGWELLNEAGRYWTPWAVALLAVVAVFALGRRRLPDLEESQARRLHALTLSLVAIVVASFVMMIGGSLDVFGTRISMPGQWLGAVIPGFSMLRGPSRWGILAAVALPVLAGLGAYAIDRLFKKNIGARVLLAAASATTFAWFQIPTQPAWPGAQVTEARYAAVRELPPEGALLELPWPISNSSIDFASRSVLVSTLHWRPILNGYTGHRPGTYRFLQRIGSRLPEAEALDQLRRLTRLRYVLIDVQATPLGEQRAWAGAARSKRVSLVHQTAHTMIYEIRGWDAPSAGELMPALLSPEPREKTFNNHPREELRLAKGAGALSAKIAPNVKVQGIASTALLIRNSSGVDWPGFDTDEEGLVRIRYSYLPIPSGPDDKRDVATHIAPIEIDIPAGASRLARVALKGPLAPGAYELCIDLVQRFADSDDGNKRYGGLPVEPRRGRVQATGKALDSAFAKMINSAYVPPAPPPPCGSVQP